MKRIFKYPFKGSDNKLIVKMPKDAIVHHVDNWGTICLWAEIVAEEKKTEWRHFIIIETGEAFTEEGKEYIGTVIGGGLVKHVYEVKHDQKWYSTNGLLLANLSEGTELNE